ncbi:MAG: hypothetical protein M0R49_09130 [Limnochordia bacterium]|nr:hypothetical protein [Limnochordia bacterium]
MCEKPILFSTDMVRAILDGRKTMTRRIVKGLPDDQSGCDLGVIKTNYGELTGYGFETMPYQPGDILWVRETWAMLNLDHHPINVGNPDYPVIYVYKADHETGNDGPDRIKWRPSIHMPREAARIFLKVIDVRVERLQDVTPEDIAAEGLPSFIIPPGHEHYKNVCGENWLGFDWYIKLWNNIYAKRGYGWKVNPWVWVIEFERKIQS